MRTNEIFVNAGDVSLRGLLYGSEVRSVYTCGHFHPAGYGEGHSMYFECSDRTALQAFCLAANATRRGRRLVVLGGLDLSEYISQQRWEKNYYVAFDILLKAASSIDWGLSGGQSAWDTVMRAETYLREQADECCNVRRRLIDKLLAPQ